MSTTTTVIISIVVPLLLSAFFNFYGNRPWILYFPVLAILLGLGYTGYRYIYSLSSIWIPSFVFAAVLLAIGYLGHRFIQSLETYKPKHADAISKQVLTSQLHELRELQDFIGGKEESELWELFDLHDITRFNIRRAKMAIDPSALTPEEASKIDAFFKNGQAMSDATSCKVTRTAGGFRIDAIPGKLGMLNLSKKYVASRQTLAKFQSSAQLPLAIRNAVKDLDQAVVGNAQLLLEVINQKLAENPANILREEDGTSPLLGATSGAFLDKCTRLKPKQEEIISAIRRYLKTQ